MHRFFGEEATVDGTARAGQFVGNVIGVFVYVVMIWVVFRSI
jgi:hypothetical protein